ncbi:hypothetical protein JW698_01395 [Candidatus Wolfebacteria bacterium]|nr:hypothetical protein [Candidatus Wolfebacteria bacterium]
MSTVIKTENFGALNCNFNFEGKEINSLSIGAYEVPMDEFCNLAVYVLNGGSFGWNKNPPKCVKEAIKKINE